MSINKRNAFTMIEMIISMSIMAFFVIAIAFSVNKKAQEKLGMSTGGYFACYKDADNILKSETEIQYEDTTYRDSGSGGTSCTFKLPEGISIFTVTLVGGGGGAAGSARAQVVYDEKHDIDIELLNSDDEVINSISNIISDEVYRELFLQDFEVVVSGGSNLYGNSGAKCSKKKISANIGDKFTIKSGDAENGKNCMKTGVIDWECTPSTAGIVTKNGDVELLAQGRVAYTGYPGDTYTDTPLSDPGCNGGEEINPEDKSDDVYYPKYAYSAKLITRIDNLAVGNAGSKGAVIEKTNQKAEWISKDRTVTIYADSIGNGGLAGEAGKDGEPAGKDGSAGTKTTFVISGTTHSAAGGNGGSGVTSYSAEAISIDEDKIVSTEFENRENPKRLFTKVGQKAEISSYVDGLFKKMTIAAQEKMESRAGFCSEETKECFDAQLPQTASYGSGGSSGAVGIVYDPIVFFKLYDENGNIIKSTPVHEPDVIVTKGANGSGGAVIISW